MRKVIVKGLTIEAGASQEVAFLFLALNTLGYDDENNSRGMSTVRRRIRDALTRSDLGRAYPRLRRAVTSYHPWPLLSAIFSPRQHRSESIQKILGEFEKFSREALVRKLWQNVRRIQRASAKILFPILERELRNLTSLFGKLPRGIQRIILIPNPLDAYWRGYQLRAGSAVYLVVGPGAAQDHGTLIRHELLHLFAKRIWLPYSFRVHPTQRLARQGYSTSRILREEYAVRALDAFYRSRLLKEGASRILARECRDFPKIREALTIISRKVKR